MTGSWPSTRTSSWEFLNPKQWGDSGTKGEASPAPAPASAPLFTLLCPDHRDAVTNKQMHWLEPGPTWPGPRQQNAAPAPSWGANAANELGEGTDTLTRKSLCVGLRSSIQREQFKTVPRSKLQPCHMNPEEIMQLINKCYTAETVVFAP